MNSPTFLAVLIAALAAYRLTRIVVADSITDPARAWLWRRTFAEAGWDSERDRPAVIVVSRAWWWVHELVTCPFCTGWWVSLGVWAAWIHWPTARPAVVAVAVAGGQALLSSRAGA